MGFCPGGVLSGWGFVRVGFCPGGVLSGIRCDGKRPDGVSLIPWSSDRMLVWDSTCPDTIAPSHINHTSTAAGAAAFTAETNKRSKYAALDHGYEFVPVAVETL